MVLNWVRMLRPFPVALFIAASVFLVISLYVRIHRESTNHAVTLLCMMCYAVPTAGRSIIGGSFADLPFPWFYVFAILLVVVLLTTGVRADGFRKGRPSMAVVVATLTVCITPIYLFGHGGPSPEAIKDMLTPLLYNCVLLASLLHGSTLNGAQEHLVLSSWTASAALVGGLIAVQHLGYTTMGLETGVRFLGASRISAPLMFTDLSSATVFLACGILIALRSIIGFNMLSSSLLIRILQTFLALLGISLSSARTGFGALAFTLAAMLLFDATIRKMKAIVFAGLLLLGGVAGFGLSRWGLSAGDLILADSGRLRLLSQGLRLFLERPLLGVGWGDWSVATMPIAPHNSYVKLLIQTGVLYANLVFGMLAYLLARALRNRDLTAFWLLWATLVGSMVTPGLLSTRYVMIITSLIALSGEASSDVVVRSAVALQSQSSVHGLACAIRAHASRAARGCRRPSRSFRPAMPEE
jgi:hypothetical protein